MAGKNTTIGTLYGIGVGPGDPDLITLKAIKVLKEVDVIFCASSSANDHSIAQNIIAPHLNGNLPVRRLPFPMVRDKGRLKDAWAENARTVLRELRAGKDVAFLTLGDPLTYSTFGHLLKALFEIEPGIPVVTVPGITSYHAAAARLNLPIAHGNKGFYVVSGVDGGGDIKEALKKSHTVFVLKAYREIENIKAVLRDLGLEDEAVLVREIGLEGEEISKGLSSVKERPPYLSLVIVPKPCTAKGGKNES